MLNLWGMRSIPLLPELPGPVWLGVAASNRVISIGQIELKCVFKLNRIFLNKTICMYKMDLALNNLQL